MSKIIRDCIAFALLCSVNGLENLHHLLNQSDEKLKPIATWSLTFSRTLSSFACIYFEFSLAPCDIYLYSDWLLRLLWFWFYDTLSKALSMRHMVSLGSMKDVQEVLEVQPRATSHFLWSAHQSSQVHRS